MFLTKKVLYLPLMCTRMELDKKLYSEINEYCKLNGLKTRDFIHKILKEAFLREKYADTPFMKSNMSENEACAVEKIKEMIEGQASLPAEIAEAVDEHFFEMVFTDDSAEKTQETQVPEPPEPVQEVSGTPAKEEVKKPKENVTKIPNVGIPKKKRSLN